MRAATCQSTAGPGGVVGLVRREDGEGRGHAAMGHRNAGGAGHADGRGDARDDLEGDARLGQRQHLLAAAAEHERVAALEPHDDAAGAGMPHHQVVDALLPVVAGRAGRAAAVDALGVGGRVIEQAGMGQPVVEHHVGVPQRLDAAER